MALLKHESEFDIEAFDEESQVKVRQIGSEMQVDCRTEHAQLESITM